MDDLGTSYSAITSPRTALLSTDLEEKWKHNERPLNAMAIQKDRKRYHLVLTPPPLLALQIDSHMCHKCNDICRHFGRWNWLLHFLGVRAKAL